MTHPRFRLLATFLLLFGLTTLSGCGPAKANVSGKVTYAGKPVTSGSISLIGSDSIQYSAQISSDGTYSIPDVPVGKVKILVSSPNPGGENRGAAAAQRQAAGQSDLAAAAPTAPAAVAAPKDWVPIPEQYSDVSKSDLTGTISGNPSVVNVDIPK